MVHEWKMKDREGWWVEEGVDGGHIDVRWLDGWLVAGRTVGGWMDGGDGGMADRWTKTQTCFRQKLRRCNL